MTFPPDSVLTSGKLGIMLIDLQRKFLDGTYNHPLYRQILGVARSLIHFAGQHPDRTMLFDIRMCGDGLTDRQMARAPGLARLSFPRNSLTAYKVTDDAFRARVKHNGERKFLSELLRQHHIQTLVLAGVHSTACVAATYCGGLERSFHMMLPSDAHGNFDTDTPTRPAIKEFADAVYLCGIPQSMQPRSFIATSPTSDLLTHLTSVWKRHQSPAADSPLPSLPSATALQVPSSAPPGLV